MLARFFISILTLEKWVLYAMLLGGLLGGLMFGWVVADTVRGQELQLLSAYRPSTPTRLYDRNGKVFAELYRHKQDLIPYNSIPPHVVKIFLAVEDDNFYGHFGIDIPGIFRAAIKNLLAGRIVQGGSTLTQQLAKQLYLHHEGSRGRTFDQKIKESLLALQIEEELSKDEILEVFFNVIYLGHGCQGLVCASRLYFNKAVEDLTLAEASLLARLPKAPVNFSPFRNPRRSLEAHKGVLRLLASKGILEEKDVESVHYEFWKDYWPRVIVHSPTQNIWSARLDLAPYFTDMVRQVLETEESVGPDLLYTGGLQVYTTLDLEQQEIMNEEMGRSLRNANAEGERWARASLDRTFARIGSARNFSQMAVSGGISPDLFEVYDTLSTILPIGAIKIQGRNERQVFRKTAEFELLDGLELLGLFVPTYNEDAAFTEFRKQSINYKSNIDVQGAMVMLEPRTGFITSIIGGSEFSPRNQFNRALMARRQPGSAFKIFVYGAALEQRMINSSTSLNDAPLLSLSPDGRAWSPVNYEEGFVGVVSAETAFAASINTCAVQTYYIVGSEPIIDLASRLMKIKDRNRFSPDPALALGASEVTPMELATAVAIINNEGKDVIPFAVRYATDQSGSVIYNQEEQIRKILATKAAQGKLQVIEKGLAYILRHMMRKVADEGTATAGLRYKGGYTGEFGAKTGTTTNWSDAWVTGFNPEYATAVWFGFDQARTTLGPGQAGGTLATPVMGHVFRRFYQGKRLPSFEDLPGKNEEPDDIVEAGCEGFALKATTINGQLVEPPDEGVCGATEKYRIWDQRELLMKEFAISRDELGLPQHGKIRFRRETDPTITDLRDKRQQRKRGLY
ncbi:MAG: transglycosylase domain-containing protein [Spirochaetales bacterium]|nr:transglycosylase domain-containing protein [Spirochaetales bacterium]